MRSRTESSISFLNEIEMDYKLNLDGKANNILLKSLDDKIEYLKGDIFFIENIREINLASINYLYIDNNMTDENVNEISKTLKLITSLETLILKSILYY